MRLPKPSLQARPSSCFDQSCMGNEHIVWDGEINWQWQDAANCGIAHLISSWLQLLTWKKETGTYIFVHTQSTKIKWHLERVKNAECFLLTGSQHWPSEARKICLLCIKPACLAVEAAWEWWPNEEESISQSVEQISYEEIKNQPH